MSVVHIMPWKCKTCKQRKVGATVGVLPVVHIIFTFLEDGFNAILVHMTVYGCVQQIIAFFVQQVDVEYDGSDIPYHFGRRIVL